MMYFLFSCFTGLAYIDVKHLKFLKLVATLKYRKKLWKDYTYSESICIDIKKYNGLHLRSTGNSLQFSAQWKC